MSRTLIHRVGDENDDGNCFDSQTRAGAKARADGYVVTRSFEKASQVWLCSAASAFPPAQADREPVK